MVDDSGVMCPFSRQLQVQSSTNGTNGPCGQQIVSNGTRKSTPFCQRKRVVFRLELLARMMARTMLVQHTSGPTMEKVMTRKITIAVVGAIVSLSSCKSAQNQASAPAPGALSAASGQSDPAKLVQPANREIAEILLALQRVHFPFDSSELTRQSRSALDDAADKLTRYPTVQLEVAGHTDARGTGEYNLALGDRRARVVTQYLTRMGVASEQLRPVSYGEEQPLMTGASQLAWAKNRRADFRLLHGDVKLAVDDGQLIDDRGQPLTTDQAAANTPRQAIIVRK